MYPMRLMFHRSLIFKNKEEMGKERKNMDTDKVKSKKYMSDIHLEDYTQQYEEKKADVSTMVFDGGRKTQSLNGQWNYAIDQYDTCLRQKWFLEKYFDEKGYSLPVDANDFSKLLYDSCKHLLTTFISITALLYAHNTI